MLAATVGSDVKYDTALSYTGGFIHKWAQEGDKVSYSLRMFVFHSLSSICLRIR